MRFWKTVYKVIFGNKSDWNDKSGRVTILRKRLKQRKRTCNQCQKIKRTTVTSREYTCRVCTPNK